MGKKKWLLVMACILLSICFPNRVRAEYYENHVDRGDYCMQAKDVRITEAQRQAWIKDGTLQEKIQELSGVFVNQFHPSDSTRYWTAYDGGYEADLQALEELKLAKEKTAEIVRITFYLTENSGIFITIHVMVLSSEQEIPSQEEAGEAVQMDNTGQKEKELLSDEITEYEKEKGKSVSTEPGNINPKSGLKHDIQKEGYLYLVWLIMTIMALLGYGNSLYSDFKVLKKYKRKLEEREGKE